MIRIYTEWSPIWTVIIRLRNNRTTMEQKPDFLTPSKITDRVKEYDVLLQLS